MMPDKHALTLEFPAHIPAELETRVTAGHCRGESGAVQRTSDEELLDWIATEGAARYDRVLSGEPTVSPPSARGRHRTTPAGTRRRYRQTT